MHVLNSVILRLNQLYNIVHLFVRSSFLTDSFVSYYRASAVAASPVLATIGMSVRLSVRPSVCHTLALSENDAS